MEEVRDHGRDDIRGSRSEGRKTTRKHLRRKHLFYLLLCVLVVYLAGEHGLKNSVHHFALREVIEEVQRVQDPVDHPRPASV